MRLIHVFLLTFLSSCDSSSNDYLTEMIKYYKEHSNILHQVEKDFRNNVPKNYLISFSKVDKEIKVEIYRRDSVNPDSIKLVYQMENLKENDSVQLLTVAFKKDFFNRIRLYLLGSEIKSIVGLTPDNSVMMKYTNTGNGGIFEYDLFSETVSAQSKSFKDSDCSFYKINDSCYIHYLYGFVGNRCINQ